MNSLPCVAACCDTHLGDVTKDRLLLSIVRLLEFFVKLPRTYVEFPSKSQHAAICKNAASKATVRDCWLGGLL